MSGIEFMVWDQYCPVCGKVTQHECCGYEKMSATRCNTCFTKFPEEDIEEEETDATT